MDTLAGAGFGILVREIFLLSRYRKLRNGP
jgi:hypothetical protein